jgi:zinc protease
MKFFKPLLLLCFGLTLSAQAQEYNLNDPLPVDKNIRIGKLPNGLTYYIRKNGLPEKRVELRLVVNAGSILENDDQQGLAHFTEHMAFNGTKHFEKNELVSYLQSVGIKFGSNLNAYTSFDETVYRLLVPTDKADVVDKAFFVLEDWAANLTLDPKEIEKERGIILEEWRIGRGASQRLRDQYFPVMFHHSQYGKRLPIGKENVIRNFKHETLINFYKEWYRPDLMAVIVVGDIDVDQYEKIIKQHFGGMVNPKKARPRTIFEVPDHQETLYSITADKEATQTQVYVYMKQDHKDETTLGDYRKFLKEKIYYFMINQRLAGLSRSSNPPYVFAKSGFENIARSKDAFSITMRVDDNGVEKGLTAALTELERAKRFGFTQVELDRARKSIAMMYGRAFNENGKTESEGYASEMIRNFLAKEAMPGIEFENAFANNQLPLITVEEMNAFDNTFLIDSNRVVIVTGPQKEGVTMPTEQRLREIVDGISKLELEPYSEKVVNFIWPGEKPKAGTILNEKKDEAHGITELTLSNGAKVWLKPTDFKNDETYLVAYSKGGHSLVNDNDYFSASYASTLVNESGIANLEKGDMAKAFAGKDVSVKPFLSAYNEGLSCKGAPKDLELLFQLANLYFTQAKIDSAAAVKFVEKTKTSINALRLNPQKSFGNEVSRILSSNHPRGGGFPSDADLDKIDYKRSQTIFRERFANAADFVFVVVGSFDMEKTKALLETYIASLPASSARETSKDLGIRPPKGYVEKDFFKGTDQKCSVQLTFTGTAKYSADDNFIMKAMNDVLTIKLMENLREKKSGTYGVRSRGQLIKYPYEHYVQHISFQCAPDNADSLIQAALAEVENIKKFGVAAADLNKVKETQKNDLEVSLKDNTYWTNELTNDLIDNNQITTGSENFAQIEKLTSKQIQKAAQKFFGKNYAKTVLYPENRADGKTK